MRSILITGASSGIGRATAIAAVRDGWRVIACGRDEERLAQLREEVTGVETLAFDLLDEEACARALSGLAPDVSVLNAGVCEYVDVKHWDPALFRRVFDANFFSVVNCLTELLPQARPGSQIVFVDSLARLLPFTRSEAYGASKAAVYYLAKSLQVDLEARGVTVQSVSPGFVRTPLTDRNEFSMPMRVEPEEAAQAILKSIHNRDSSGYFPALFAGVLRILGALPSAMQVAMCRRLARRAEVS
ncbi:MAG: SDR family NAD(P)-dependent oxidoreductase [Pseudomonadota bacterium]